MKNERELKEFVRLLVTLDEEKQKELFFMIKGAQTVDKNVLRADGTAHYHELLLV